MPASFPAVASASQTSGPRPQSTDLESVLARVAPCGQQRRRAGDVALGDRVVAQRREVDVRDRGQDITGAGTLDRDERGRKGPVVEHGLPAVQAMGQLIGNDRRVAGVGHDEERSGPRR